MPGTGGTSYDRPLVGIWWETGDEIPEGAPVRISAVNADDTSDEGDKAGVNNGQDYLTYAHGTTVVDHVTITGDGADGEPVLIAEFDIAIKVA